MIEEVRNKLWQIYEGVTKPMQDVIRVFEEQFTEELVDNTLISFESFLERLNAETLGTMGIKSWKGTNDLGSFTIDKDDYELNGRGKPFLEYIPDIGIIDYLTIKITDKLVEFNDLVNELFHRDCDYSGIFIIIRFPKVTVTNEYDQSINIYDLFVRVPVLTNGTIGGCFTMNRSTFTIQQWLSSYSHSHLPRIDTDELRDFKTPCLGSGPIKDTINTLAESFDLDIWGLFAFELSKYVAVESVAGVPYIRLENVGDAGSALNREPFFATFPYLMTAKETIDFIKYFVSLGIMKISYNGIYTLGESYTDYWIKVSNAFIEWYNMRVIAEGSNEKFTYLLRKGILGKYVIRDGIIYDSRYASRAEEITSFEGKPLFQFKGEVVKLHFLDNLDDVTPVYLISDSTLCNYILTRTLQIINYNYGRTNKRTNKRTKGESQVGTRVFYF